jgi:hypothetical protein
LELLDGSGVAGWGLRDEVLWVSGDWRLGFGVGSRGDRGGRGGCHVMGHFEGTLKCQGSRVKGQGSRVKGQGSRVKGQGSRERPKAKGHRVKGKKGIKE